MFGYPFEKLKCTPQQNDATRRALLNVTLQAASSNENLRKFPLRFTGMWVLLPRRRIPPSRGGSARPGFAASSETGGGCFFAIV